MTEKTTEQKSKSKSKVKEPNKSQPHNKTKNQSAHKKSSKDSNPLFVVTKKGEVVEEAKNLWDAFLKKYQLTPYFEMFEDMMNSFFKEIKNYAVLKAALEYFDYLLEEFKALLAKWEKKGRPYLKMMEGFAF